MPFVIHAEPCCCCCCYYYYYYYDDYDYDYDYDYDNDNDYNYVRQGRAGRRTVDCPYYPFYLCYPPALYTERVIEYVIECVIE